MTKKRRTLIYTPLGIRPIIHHGPPDPDANLLSLDFSPSAAANVDAVVTAAPTTAARKRRRGYGRTVSQKKEARQARRERGTMMIMGGDSAVRHHRSNTREDEDDNGEVLEEARRGEHALDVPVADDRGRLIDDVLLVLAGHGALAHAGTKALAGTGGRHHGMAAHVSAAPLAAGQLRPARRLRAWQAGPRKALPDARRTPSPTTPCQ